MLGAGYRNTFYLYHATSNDLSNSLAGGFQVPGTMLSAFCTFFHLILITAYNVEGVGLLSHAKFRNVKQQDNPARKWQVWDSDPSPSDSTQSSLLLAQAFSF